MILLMIIRAQETWLLHPGGLFDLNRPLITKVVNSASKLWDNSILTLYV